VCMDHGSRAIRRRDHAGGGDHSAAFSRHQCAGQLRLVSVEDAGSGRSDSALSPSCRSGRQAVGLLADPPRDDHADRDHDYGVENAPARISRLRLALVPDSPAARDRNHPSGRSSSRGPDTRTLR
jgi:hypothetical protein